MRARILVVVVVAVVSVSTIYRTKYATASASTAVTPFTATVDESHFKSDGTFSRVETFTVAFRTDGSFMRMVHRALPNGGEFEIKEVVDRASGNRTVVDYATRSLTTYPIRGSDARYFSDVSSACVNDKQGERSSILGYEVVLRHEGKTDNDGATRIADRWESPALNCFPLREIITPPAKAGVKVPHNERQVTKVVAGEPDASLFGIPQDFVERSPSQRQTEFERLYGTAMPPLGPSADRVYKDSRAHQ